MPHPNYRIYKPLMLGGIQTRRIIFSAALRFLAEVRYTISRRISGVGDPPIALTILDCGDTFHPRTFFPDKSAELVNGIYLWCKNFACLH